MKFFFFLPLLIFIVLGVFLWRGLSLNPAMLPSALIDKPAPAFELTTIFDAQKKLTPAIFSGKVTVVNVWASWCGACKAEHETLLQLAHQRQVQMVGWDYKDSRADAKHYLVQQGNPYQIVLWDNAGHAALNWGIYGTPETFIIDKKGLIRYKHVGPLSAPGVQTEVMSWVEKLLHE